MNLMPYAILKKFGLGKAQPTMMKFLMADHSLKKPIRVLNNVQVKVDRLIFLDDFVILDCVIDIEVPIILERLFLASEKALVDMESGEI